MRLAMLIGIAKQIPWADWMMAVLMPITRPRLSSSGPPLLPGLSAASVWITLSTRWPVMLRSVRPSALITPAVTVESKPNGLPIATTSWPDAQARRFAELGVRQPRGVGLHDRDVGPWIGADHAAGDLAAVVQPHPHPAHAANHVMVGQQKAVGREQERRTPSQPGRRPPSPAIARKFTTAGPSVSATVTITRE